MTIGILYTGLLALTPLAATALAVLAGCLLLAAVRRWSGWIGDDE